MATNKRPFTMRMQPENFDKMRVIAALNKRSVAMQIEYLMEQCISDYEARFGRIMLNDVGSDNQKNSRIETSITNSGDNSMYLTRVSNNA